MRMASAWALTIAGMPTPASSAEPAAPLTSVRRDNLEFMAIPPFEDIRADCADRGRGFIVRSARLPPLLRANIVARLTNVVQRIFPSDCRQRGAVFGWAYLDSGGRRGSGTQGTARAGDHRRVDCARPAVMDLM